MNKEEIKKAEESFKGLKNMYLKFYSKKSYKKIIKELDESWEKGRKIRESK